MISTDVAAALVLIPLLIALEKSLPKHYNGSGIHTIVLSSLKRKFEDVERHDYCNNAGS